MKLNHKIFGDGEPIIVLHGLFGMLDNWRSFARAVENQYKVILVDLRNHGCSPHSTEMSYPVMAEDIHRLMDDLSIKETILMGHSMGGKVAMRFALDHPGKVKKLIVVDISPKKYPPHHDNVIDAIESIQPHSISDRSEAESAFRDKLGNDEATTQFLLKNLSRKPEGGFEWKANMPVLISNYDALMDGISADTSFDKPTLFITGANSRTVSGEDWPETRKMFPAAKKVSIPDAGHWVHADQPEMLIKEVLSFLSSG